MHILSEVIMFGTGGMLIEYIRNKKGSIICVEIEKREVSTICFYFPMIISYFSYLVTEPAHKYEALCHLSI